ncbi:MAG TPA: serine/threonine-protein kinase, partial [Gemmatimonadaceae bacterium]
RDVKPANVLWDEENERATVSDFGIAGLISDGDESEIRITQGGMTVGSPAYMSPEQLLAEPLTPKSDIYALGLLGYELLAGRSPFDATAPAAIATAHLRDEPRALSVLRADVPPTLEALLLRCLAKNAAERPTAEEAMVALAPGAAEALEWPPPGLERARGALWRVMTTPALAALLLLVPLVLFMRLGRDVTGDSFIEPLILAAASIIGFTAFVRGAVRAWRVAQALVVAARLGYGWGTIAEVLVDRRGDTGALIAGTREYAGLATHERSALRVLRVARATLLFLAAPVALFVAFVMLALFGSGRSGEVSFATAVMFTLIVFAVLGVVAGLPEQIELAGIRRRRSVNPRHASELELAPAWYAAFERSREGQPFGAGARVQRVLAVGLVSVATAVVLFCAAVLLLANLFTVAGQTRHSALGPSLTPRLLAMAQRNGGGRTYRLPADSSTSPREAGEALLAVASTDDPPPPSAYERHAATTYPAWKRLTPAAKLFPAREDATWTDAAILAAAHGLTAEQQRFLEQASAHPARDEFSRAARASQLDVFGALLATDSARIHPNDFPVVELFRLEDAGESHAAMTALDVAHGRFDAAERHAREIIAVGDLLLDAPFSANVTEGFRMVRRGLSTLEAVYIAAGRERDARILMDSVARGATRISNVPIRPTTQLGSLLYRNARYPRGVRLEMMMLLLLDACADPRQLLFGVDAHTRGLLVYARDTLARFPSERVWVDGLAGMIQGDLLPRDAAQASDAYTRLVRVVDAVVGGHRFENCARWD